MGDRDSTRLSRLMSHALRHESWVYELELDAEGWVPVDELLNGLRDRGRRWSTLDQSDLVAVVESSAKRRFELRDSQIRALYGHSTPRQIAKVPAPPPERLFHGTSPEALPDIRRRGLLPMGRQYVHLSTDRATARSVGQRKSGHPLLLTIAARKAFNVGVPFYAGNDQVWLADRVPPDFIEEPPSAG